MSQFNLGQLKNSTAAVNLVWIPVLIAYMLCVQRTTHHTQSTHDMDGKMKCRWCDNQNFKPHNIANMLR